MKTSNRLRADAAALFLLLLFSSSCVNQKPESDSKSPLYVSPAARDFSENPELLQRILAGPHGYFRFINIQFSNEVCHRFSELLRGTPSFNLHGDAHLEQYAVTDLGRGLTDFDDSSTGPALIDLMRFGVSLHLACRERGWEDRTESLYDRFLQGYREALRDPGTKAPEPAVVRRMRARFKFDRPKYFKWIASVMAAMPDTEKQQVSQALAPYFEAMRVEHPELPRAFFEIMDMGYLRMGIGSALDLKYLVRVRGKSADPDDDVVLEVKQVRDLTGISCITTAQKADPFRVLVGQARIAYQPYNYLGYIRYRGLTFWVHAWVDNYKEFKIGKTARTVDELAEVAYDIGVQLGRGHTNQIAAPLDKQLCREQLRLIDKSEAQIKRTCLDLANETVEAWKEFCAEVRKKS